MNFLQKPYLVCLLVSVECFIEVFPEWERIQRLSLQPRQFTILPTTIKCCFGWCPYICLTFMTSADHTNSEGSHFWCGGGGLSVWQILMFVWWLVETVITWMPGHGSVWYFSLSHLGLRKLKGKICTGYGQSQISSSVALKPDALSLDL